MYTQRYQRQPMISNGRFVITEKALHAQLCRTLKTESLSGAEVIQATTNFDGHALTFLHCRPSHLRRDPAFLPRYIAGSCAIRKPTGTKLKGRRVIRTCHRDCEYRAVADINKSGITPSIRNQKCFFSTVESPSCSSQMPSPAVLRRRLRREL